MSYCKTFTNIYFILNNILLYFLHFINELRLHRIYFNLLQSCIVIFFRNLVVFGNYFLNV